MQSQQRMSVPAVCCRAWGAGWERLHLGRTGELRPIPCSIHQVLTSGASPLLWPQCPVKPWAATSKPQLVRSSPCQRPWWLCTAIPQAQAPRSSPSSGCRESWSKDSICVPAHKGRGGGVQRRQKPNGQTAGGSEQSLVEKAGAAPGMGTGTGSCSSVAADTQQRAAPLLAGSFP